MDETIARFVLNGFDFQSWKRGSVYTFVHGQEAITMLGGVSADQEVGKNAPGGGSALFAAPLRVASERPASRSPYRFAQMPINRNARVFKESIHEILSSTGAD
jgi:hypothetical protein